MHIIVLPSVTIIVLIIVILAEALYVKLILKLVDAETELHFLDRVCAINKKIIYYTHLL